MSWKCRCRRFVEDVERAAGVALRQLERELDALGLATRQRGRALTQSDVAETDVHQGLELARHARHRLEESQGLLHGHLQHFLDAASLVADLQCLAVVALAVADVAGHVHVGQEVHLDLDQAVALTGLAAPAADIEGKTSGFVAACARFRHAGKQFADRCEHAGVGRGVGARRAPDRGLIDVDHLVEAVQPLDVVMGRDFHA